MLRIWNNWLYSPIPFYCKNFPFFQWVKTWLKNKVKNPTNAGLGLPITCFADWQCQVNFVSSGQAAFKPKTGHLTRSAVSPVHTGMSPRPPDNPLTEMDYKSIGWESDRGWLRYQECSCCTDSTRVHKRQPGNAWGQECHWLRDRLPCSLATASTAPAPMHSVKATGSIPHPWPVQNQR